MAMKIDAEMIPVMLNIMSFLLAPKIFNLLELKSKYLTVSEKIAIKMKIEYIKFEILLPKLMISMKIW